MKVIYKSPTKTLSSGHVIIEKPKVLLVAPTSVAAIQVDGTTMHTALQIPVGHFGTKSPPLHEKINVA